MSTTAFKTFSGSCPNSCKDMLDVKTMGIALSQHGGKFMTRRCTKIAKTCLPQPGLLRNRSLSSLSLQNVRVLVPLEPVQGHHFKPHFFLQITSLRTKREKHVLKTYSAFPIVLTSKITLQEFGHEPLNVLKAIVGRISG